MHLPPLDVAVYPVVTMSHGRHGSRAVRTSSTTPLSSSAATPPSHPRTMTPDFSSIQKVIRDVFRSSRITVQQAERLQGRIHQVYLARLADGSTLVLKCPPNCTTRTLRHERHSLETERKTLETLHEYTNLPVPQVIKYDARGVTLGSPFLLMSYVPGRKLSELLPYLSTDERKSIDRTLGAYVGRLTSLSATQFGMTHQVFAQRGSTKWRDAFVALNEAALRDAEEMLIHIDYQGIRNLIRRHIHVLDEVTEPRMVVLDVCDGQNILIDEQTRQVSGLVGFSNVVWGDPLMSGGIAGGSDAFYEGFGQRPPRTGGVYVRQLM